MTEDVMCSLLALIWCYFDNIQIETKDYWWLFQYNPTNLFLLMMGVCRFLFCVCVVRLVTELFEADGNLSLKIVMNI